MLLAKQVQVSSGSQEGNPKVRHPGCAVRVEYRPGQGRVRVAWRTSARARRPILRRTCRDGERDTPRVPDAEHGWHRMRDR